MDVMGDWGPEVAVISVFASALGEPGDKPVRSTPGMTKGAGTQPLSVELGKIPEDVNLISRR